MKLGMNHYINSWTESRLYHLPTAIHILATPSRGRGGRGRKQYLYFFLDYEKIKREKIINFFLIQRKFLILIIDNTLRCCKKIFSISGSLIEFSLNNLFKSYGRPNQECYEGSSSLHELKKINIFLEIFGIIFFLFNFWTKFQKLGVIRQKFIK